jgi:acyl-[acyl-carrier-protein] desaturase
MTETSFTESSGLSTRTYRLYRDFFDQAERKRRWSLRDDIPWDQCNRSLDPAIAEVVQTFCCVELFLPDYVSKLLPQVRANRGRAWFLCNWGYEESKHSLALGDWLLHSGMRTDEEMADMEREVFKHEWQLPYDNGVGMLCYTLVQELATAVHYQNLRDIVGPTGDPALYRLLQLISTDERAHHDFFRRLIALYLEEDRPNTLEQLRRVVNTFKMPAVHMLTDGSSRISAVKALRIFDEDIFLYKVFEPILAKLGVHKKEIRRRNSSREIVVMASTS